MQTIKHTFIWLTLFSIAMGYLETSVVVYLRELYYPHGFNFPLMPIKPEVAVTEFWREVATIVMLWGVGTMAGRDRTEKFAFFLYSFAIWDIFYYLFLKVLLGWPASLFTWDILFLIPVPWVGPVIASCLVSLTMVLLALAVAYLRERGYQTFIGWKEWSLLIAGSLVIILSFIYDYLQYVDRWGGLVKLWSVSSRESLFTESPGYIPQQFDWGIFWLGELLLLLAIALLVKRTLAQPINKPYRLATPGPTHSGNFADYLDGL
jgi:hypothetical protein